MLNSGSQAPKEAHLALESGGEVRPCQDVRRKEKALKNMDVTLFVAVKESPPALRRVVDSRVLDHRQNSGKQEHRG